MNQPEEVRRQGPVNQNIEMLFDLTERADQYIRILRDRIAPILKPDLETTGKCQEVKNINESVGVSFVSNAMTELRYRVQNQIEALQEIIDKVEF